MVPCGSSPVACLYLAKNEAPEGEAASVLLFNTIYVDIETLLSFVATMVRMDTD